MTQLLDLITPGDVLYEEFNKAFEYKSKPASS